MKPPHAELLLQWSKITRLQRQIWLSWPVGRGGAHILLKSGWVKRWWCLTWRWPTLIWRRQPRRCSGATSDLVVVALGTAIFTLQPPLPLATAPPLLNYCTYPKAELSPSAQRFSAWKRAPNCTIFFMDCCCSPCLGLVICVDYIGTYLNLNIVHFHLIVCVLTLAVPLKTYCLAAVVEIFSCIKEVMDPTMEGVIYVL
jgi:hypothetical protein